MGSLTSLIEIAEDNNIFHLVLWLESRTHTHIYVAINAVNTQRQGWHADVLKRKTAFILNKRGRYS